MCAFTHLCGYPQRPEEVVRYLRAGVQVTHSCGCWELNSSPLQEQQALITTEPSLQPQIILKLFFFVCLFGVGFTHLCIFMEVKECARLSSSISLHVFRQCLSLNLGLMFSWLDWKPASPTILPSPPLLSWGYRYVQDASLLHVHWHRESGSHYCTASAHKLLSHLLAPVEQFLTVFK